MAIPLPGGGMPLQSSDSQSRARMFFAYRELLSPGILVLIAVILCALTIFLVLVGPYGMWRVLTFQQRALVCALSTVIYGSVYYSAAVMVLYVMRFQSQVRKAVGLAAYVIVAPLVCLPVPFLILERLFRHDVWTPRMAAFEYLTSVLILAAATTLLYYIVCLRVTRIELLRSTAHAAEHEAPAGNGRLAISDRSNESGSVNDAVPHTVSGAGADSAATATPPTRNDASADEAPAMTTEPAPTGNAQFFKRIPRELGRDVVYVKVSGHYLHVVTTRGKRVIIRSLADTVKELDGLGMQAHRSYWVAYAHIRYLVRRNRRAFLRLDVDDHEIPVSRTFLRDVKRVVGDLTARRRG